MMTAKAHITPRSGAKLAPPRDTYIALAQDIASGASNVRWKSDLLAKAVREYLNAFSSRNGAWSSDEVKKTLFRLQSLIGSVGLIFHGSSGSPYEYLRAEDVAQPNDVARLALMVEPFARHLAALFGYRVHTFESIDDEKEFEQIDGAEGFASALFWTEAKSILERELKPDIDRMYFYTRKMPAQEFRLEYDWHRYRTENWNRLYNIESKDAEGWGHFVVRVHERDQVEFEQRIESGEYFWKNQEIVDTLGHCRWSTLNRFLENGAYERWISLTSNFGAYLRNAKFEISRVRRYKGQYTDNGPLFDNDGEVIHPDITGKQSASERLELLDRYAADHPGEPVSVYARELFPEIDAPKIQQPPLPAKAPERWPSDPDKRKENPAEFATRVYRVWMDAGVFTRPDLKRLDPLLFSSLDNWLKNNRRKPNPEPLPEGFNLLTLGQMNDAWIDRVRRGQAQIPAGGDELVRFASALLNRGLNEPDRE